MILVENLVKKYDDITAVDDISFQVEEGEIFSLLGPNGAGKTTTLEILECLKKPTSGKAEVMGYDIYEDERKIKQNIGVMPQNFNALERLTARENIQLVADIYGKGNVDQVIETIGVKGFEKKQFMELSGGMKTKVGIGMTLVSDARLLFLDEPTTGLDPQARRETWQMIKDLKKMGKTIFLTTHYMEEVEYLSDRAAVIIDGKIKVTNTISNLIKNYGGKLKLTVKKNKETEEILSKDAEELFEESPEKITAIFAGKGKAKETLITLFSKDYDVGVIEAGMEDAFMNLAGGRINERGELV